MSIARYVPVAGSPTTNEDGGPWVPPSPRRAMHVTVVGRLDGAVRWFLEEPQ